MTLGFTPGNNLPVTVVNAPGYVDEFDATLIAYVRSVDGRPLAVIEYPQTQAGIVAGLPRTTWDVVPQGCIREPRGDAHASLYAECGCIAPCPDHTGRAPRNRDDYADRYDTWDDDREAPEDDD